MDKAALENDFEFDNNSHLFTASKTMAKNKKASSAEDDDKSNGQSSPSLHSLPSPILGPSSSSTGSKKASKPSTSALIICRNKHWRYISSFHGPWLQIPPEILETLANANYNTPRPHPVDPAVFFDLVKIRRLVEDATTLAVRAASGIAGSAQSLSNSALGLGFGQAGGGNPGKLSKERKHRMREQATQKLSRAYHLDEIACSVATMQSASSLQDVASIVLQRSREDADAKYVHFFHEKIPSRQLAESTSLEPLNEIIASRPTEAEPLRTRATVRTFKEDYEGAAMDLTAALQVHRFHHPSRKTSRPESQPNELQSASAGQQERAGRKEDIILREEEHPNSFEQQALFQRAGVYLTLACQLIPAALLVVPDRHQDEHSTVDEGRAPPTPPPEMAPPRSEASKEMLEARKAVKSYGRKALRDYMAYLAHFEYSPDLPTEVAEDFAKRVNHAVHGLRIPRSHHHHHHTPRPESQTPRSGGLPATLHRTYRLSDLFAATPPADLPPYPKTDIIPVSKPSSSTRPPSSPSPSSEALTYHPLMTEALHSLLLSHCLVQTSPKELNRHANMAARLARLADGYPVFQASRSPARADWVEVLRQGDNWIRLSGPWEGLCAPAPLPVFQGPEKEKERRERLHRKAMVAALDDDRVGDMESLRAAVRAHTLRAEEDERVEAMREIGDGEGEEEKGRGSAESGDGEPVGGPEAAGKPDVRLIVGNRHDAVSQQKSQTVVPRRWAFDDGKEYPILSERAAAVARWVLEAPAVGGDGATGRKRKKKAGAKSGGATGGPVDADGEAEHLGRDTEAESHVDASG